MFVIKGGVFFLFEENAMRTSKAAMIVSLFGLGLAANSKALAQYGYNCNSGSSRVVQQDDVGLSRPSGSYIGAGTLSKSAQGVQEQGPQANPGLPRVNRGAYTYIGTPGDNMYGAHPILSPAQQQQQGWQAVQQRRRFYGQRRDNQQDYPIQQSEQQKGFIYQPGENLKAGSGAYMAYPTPNPGQDAAIYNPQGLDAIRSHDVTPPEASHRRY